jgi:hypothetical protein
VGVGFFCVFVVYVLSVLLQSGWYVVFFLVVFVLGVIEFGLLVICVILCVSVGRSPFACFVVIVVVFVRFVLFDEVFRSFRSWLVGVLQVES